MVNYIPRLRPLNNLIVMFWRVICLPSVIVGWWYSIWGKHTTKQNIYYYLVLKHVLITFQIVIAVDPNCFYTYEHKEINLPLWSTHQNLNQTFHNEKIRTWEKLTKNIMKKKHSMWIVRSNKQYLGHRDQVINY